MSKRETPDGESAQIDEALHRPMNQQNKLTQNTKKVLNTNKKSLSADFQ